MTKITYKLLLGLVALAAFSSCKKSFIELNPPTSVSPQEAFITEGDMLIALRGAYASLRGADFYGRTLPVIGDVLADNEYQTATNTNRYTTFNAYSYVATDGNVSGMWNTGYQAILRANNIINSTSVPPSATVNQYKGEAYAIRALAYFSMIRYFARPYTDNPAGLGIPIIIKYDPDFKPARNTIAEVYTQINKDLDSAYSNMGTTAAFNSSQFSKYAAKGLQAKVYLTMGDYPKARVAADDVINNGKFTMVATDSWAGYWNDPAPKTAPSAASTGKLETLFEVSSDAVNNLQFDALPYLYSQFGNYGDFVLTDSAKGVSPLFAPGDVRLLVFPRMKRANSTAASAPTITAINKYPAIQGDRSDTKVLRYSEMYLIAAEATYLTDPTASLNYLKYLTDRRGVAPIVSAGAQLFEDIITERRKELVAEGDRYLDLQRLKRDISRPVEYPGTALNIPYSNFRRILPIPPAELDVNPAIRSQQNPGGY
jgi:starch-binding outer membrane protein, SusD/RagB family